MDNKLKLQDFFNACIQGDSDVLRFFLDRKDFDIDTKTKEGWTGLIMACYNNNNKIVKLLVQHGADVNATNSKGTTVFMYAKTPILKSGDVEILEFLLENKADINACDCYSKSVLDYVIEKKSTRLAKWLIKQGALAGNQLK